MKLESSEVLMAMMQHFGKDLRRINHAMKVFAFAKTIGGGEGLDGGQMEILEAAAILHDVGIKPAEEKYGSCTGPLQELEGPAAAKELLLPMLPETEVLERICYLIGHHHTYSAIDDAVFQILVEADFLVNAYEDEMQAPAIGSVRDKLFKTASGIRLIDLLYKTNG